MDGSSWAVAVPTAITAVSTWYLNRKTVKTHEKTNQAISDSGDSVSEEISQLEDRISKLETMVDKTRVCQVTLAQKYTDTLNALQAELVASRRVLEKLAVPDETASGPTDVVPAPTPNSGSVKVVDVPQASIGKVKWEK